MSPGVIYNNVAELMIDFNRLFGASKETLMHRVCSISHISPIGMPVSITSCCLGRISFRIYPFLFTVNLNKRTTAFSSHLSRKLARVGAIRRMAVEALTDHSTLGKYRSLIE